MKKHNGFTLLELMISIAIISVLIGIAMIKFVNLSKKAKESETKGNLGILRSAISLYFVENNSYPDEGGIPENTDTDIFTRSPFVPERFKELPKVSLGKAGIIDTDLCVYCLSVDNLSVENSVSGKWWYRGHNFGEMRIAASGVSDTAGEHITCW